VHHAAAFTRNELVDAIRAIPEMISAPPSLAERHNAPRQKLVAQHDDQHTQAESAWTQHVLWKRANRACLTLSAIGFVTGLAAPLVRILAGGSFVPM
jgi:hypothetical protein